MYRLNPLPRKVLITADEVIAAAPTEESISPGNFIKAIQIAEDRFIRPTLCKDLYNDFREKKNVIVTTGNIATLQAKFPAGTTLVVGQLVNAIEQVTNAWYVKLWNEHLWKLVAECVFYIATPTNFSRYTAMGEMMNSPKSIGGEGSGSSSVELSEVKWKLDKLLQDRIDPLIATIHEYLNDNKGNFPLYNCHKCEDSKDADGISYKRKTGWVHGIYSTRKGGCCDDD